MMSKGTEILCLDPKEVIMNDFCQSANPKLSHWKGDTSKALKKQTIGETIDLAAHRFQDRLAISFYQKEALSYNEVARRTDTLAAALLSLGLQKGDHVALWGFNSVEWYLAFLAAAKCGLVTVNLNPLYEGPELHSCLLKADVKALIMDEKLNGHQFYEILKSVIPEIAEYEYGNKITSNRAPLLSTIIIISERRYSGTFRWKDLYSKPREEDRLRLKKRQSDINVLDVGNIQFTSGTTNSPKAVQLTHFGIVNNSNFVGQYLDIHKDPQRACIPVPFFHTFGTVAAIMACINHGATVVMPSVKFSPNKTIDCIIEKKCTLMYGTPTMYIDLINVLNERSADDPLIFTKLASLKRFFSGGAICLPTLIQKLKTHFREVKFSSGYGMTEILSPFMTLPDEDEDKLLTVVGRLMEYLEVKIINSKGETVPLGVEGELCCRGYTVMKGYYNDSEKTKCSLTDDGWFHTGDRFVFLENGYAQIIGRIKETIIRGGENIEPKEIENLLLQHENISNVQVYGVSCARLGEVVASSIILKDDCKMTEDDVRKFCQGVIAPYKIPQYIFFVKEFPRTTTGKIQKFKLREDAEKLLKQENN